jgi:hypothetical protein
MEIKILEEKITEFWVKDVWKCNIKHIHNDKIKNVLSQIQKLVYSLKPNKTFIILNDGELKIKSNSKIESLIEKIKNDNIIYIKTHADCIPEYHTLIIDYKKQTLFI